MIVGFESLTFSNNEGGEDKMGCIQPKPEEPSALEEAAAYVSMWGMCGCVWCWKNNFYSFDLQSEFFYLWNVRSIQWFPQLN